MCSVSSMAKFVVLGLRFLRFGKQGHGSRVFVIAVRRLLLSKADWPLYEYVSREHDKSHPVDRT